MAAHAPGHQVYGRAKSLVGRGEALPFWSGEAEPPPLGSGGSIRHAAYWSNQKLLAMDLLVWSIPNIDTQ